MTSRREPLANVPNAVNSPFRNVGASNGKRTRAQAGDHRDAISGQPPTKKQIIEIKDEDVENVDPRKRDFVAVAAREKQDEPFMKRAPGIQPTAFEKRLASVRERKPSVQDRPEQQKKIDAANHENIKQWKRHYKKQFPGFVFYFDNVAEDAIRQRATRNIQHLGAREEKFFSKDVTHVITTRPIPDQSIHTSPEDETSSASGPLRTVQPAALQQDQRRTTSLLDANLQRRAQSQATHVSQDVDPRRMQAQGADFLVRAREMGVKLWALEKLQRILKTMFETEKEERSMTQDIRNHAAVHKTVSKAAKDPDLAQLLRNEKINGPADRDMTVAAQDMVTFKGFYIYVHDTDEKTKPVMVRDYPKPPTKEEGKWPQFRLTPVGRCPFVEDPQHTKKLQQQERNAAKAEQELAAQRKTRAVAATIMPPRPLGEQSVNLRRSPRKAAQMPAGEMGKPLQPPRPQPTQRQSSAEGMPALFGSAQQSLRGLPRMIGGEPVASGLQHSNVTSAIRSQAITSAAISSTGPGMTRRVGDTKEVSALKRKVLERGATMTSNQSMPSSYMNDVRAAINDDNNPPPRAAKRKAQETLGVLHEDEEDTQDAPRPAHRKPPAPKKRKPVQKEPKPGYCENCRDKFDDFDDHVNSRKHRKFALTNGNWTELDALLGQLKRPHKVN